LVHSWSVGTVFVSLGMEMKEYKVNVETAVTANMIECIVVGALEGGSNYWYMLGEGIPPSDGNPIADRILNALFNDSDYKLEILDLEDEEGEPLGYLTLDVLLNAFQIVSKNYPEHFYNLLTGNDDAETADVFFQCAVMGEVVFG
jgi:hypothetical protein